MSGNDQKPWWIGPSPAGGELDNSADINSLYSKNAALLAENGLLKASIARLEIERELDIMADTKTIFNGTGVMKKYEALETELNELKLRNEKNMALRDTYKTSYDFAKEDYDLLLVEARALHEALIFAAMIKGVCGCELVRHEYTCVYHRAINQFSKFIEDKNEK